MRYYLRYLCDSYILADAFRPSPHWGAKRYTVEAAALGEHTDEDVIRAAQESAPSGYWLQHVEAIGGEPPVRDVFKRAVPLSRSETPNVEVRRGPTTRDAMTDTHQTTQAVAAISHEPPNAAGLGLAAERDAVLAQLDDTTNQTWRGKRARWAALVRAQEAEIERLRDAMQHLENACDKRAGLLTPAAYCAADEIAGMREVNYELDDARRMARLALA